MKLTKKIVLGASVIILSHTAFGQTVQEGIAYTDSHKYAKAKQVYSDMIAKSPVAENYFYLGNTYLTQFEPNFELAAENFNKGAAADKKDFLNKIGLASIKLGKGDKSGIAEIQKIVAESKEKNSEVLYRAGEALTLFEKTSNPDLAVDYINKAIEKAPKTGVPAHYYYTLGDAYRLKLTNNPQVAGAAMSAYDKALAIAKNKASVYTRMGTLWMAAQQWQQARQNIDKAIAADASYAPAYKASAAYNIKYQQNVLATQDLLNYAKYADEDPYTQLEISKLFFTNEDYANAKTTLDKIFDKVDDAIKYKLRSYIQYSEGEYAQAKENMEKFTAHADTSRVQSGDKGLLGLIDAGLAKTETDAAKKSALIAESQKNIAIAKNAKDETMKWDEELAKIAGGGGATQAAADAGATNPEIEALKKQVASNPQDTDALFKLATGYQNVENWNGAILTWQKMINLLPDWAPAYYSQGLAYQQAKNNELAKIAYEKYISKVNPAELEANRESLSYAYFAVAYLEKDSNLEKAKQYAAKAVELNPAYQDAVNLNKQLNP
ncbi:MAG: tetratricopeptide repeat protein [Bergeyella sp.]